MFRTGLYLAQHYDDDYLRPLLDDGLESNATIVGLLTSPVEIFHSDLSYFAGAAAVELLAILTILFTFRDRQGRTWQSDVQDAERLTLRQQAFDAPVLRAQLGNSTGKELEKSAGSSRVRYGAVSDYADYSADAESEYEKLCIAPSEMVSKPNGRRTTFGEYYRILTTDVARQRQIVKQRL
jgi:hypothetical protein